MSYSDHLEARVAHRLGIVRLDKLLWVSLTLLFFTFSGFSVMDLLGIRRPFQFVMLATAGTIGFFYMMLHVRNITLRPISTTFFLYVGALGVTAYFWQQHHLLALNMLVVLFVVLLLAFAPAGRWRDFERLMIIGSTVFAALGITQFVILLFHPEWMPHAGSHGNALYLSNEFAAKHPIAMLGLTSGSDLGYHILGFQVARMRSFMFEPSLVIAYFMLPAGVALVGSRRARWCGVILGVFCFLTFSGAAFLSVAIGVGALLLFRWTRSRIVFLILPFAQAIALSVLSDPQVVEMTAELLNAPGRFLQEHTGVTIFLKPISARARLEMFGQAMYEIYATPFGSGARTNLSVGTFWLAHIIGSPIAFLLNIIVMGWIYYQLGGVMAKLLDAPRRDWIGLAGLVTCYGVCHSLFAFTSYGFTNAFGLIWLYILLRRIHDWRRGLFK